MSKIFYILYFFKIGVIDKYGYERHWGKLEKKFEATRDAKKDIMGAKNLIFYMQMKIKSHMLRLM